MRSLDTLLALSALTLIGCAHGGASTTAPTTTSFARFVASGDQAGFTEEARARVAAALRSVSVTIGAEPLVLDIDGRMMVSLGRPYLGCQQNPASCDAFTEDYLASVCAMLTRPEDDRRPTPENLRLALRSRERVEAYTLDGRTPVAEPFMGDLFAVVMVDFPESAAVLVEAQLPELGLDRAAAIARARANVLAEIGPFAPAQTLRRGEPALGYITERYYYESSRLLDPASLHAVAQSLGGALYVAVPAFDTLFFAEAEDPLALESFAQVTSSFYASSTQSLSTHVFVYRNGTLTLAR